MNFTEQERQVINLICNQKTSKEIGDELSLTKRQVDAIKTVLLIKTESTNIVGVVVYAIKNGIYLLI